MKHNGGPAFPHQGRDYAGQTIPGMSLRDYFAAAALQGFIACPDTPDIPPSKCASHCYQIADAMLAERDK